MALNLNKPYKMIRKKNGECPTIQNGRVYDGRSGKPMSVAPEKMLKQEQRGDTRSHGGKGSRKDPPPTFLQRSFRQK